MSLFMNKFGAPYLLSNRIGIDSLGSSPLGFDFYNDDLISSTKSLIHRRSNPISTMEPLQNPSSILYYNPEISYHVGLSQLSRTAHKHLISDHNPAYGPHEECYWHVPFYPQRIESPDRATTPCSSWSGSFHGDMSSYVVSSHLIPNTQSRYDRIDLGEYSSHRNFPMGISFGGGSCTLSDIQHFPDTAPDDSNPGIQQEVIPTTATIKIEHDSSQKRSPQEYDREKSLPLSTHSHCEDDSDDSDYQLHRRTKSNRPRMGQILKHGRTMTPHRQNNQTQSNDSQTNRVLKKKSKSLSRAASSPRKRRKNESENRPFQCPLASYSCLSTFSSKNEWKRHVSTQHIRLGFWRCDLCLKSGDTMPSSGYFNDFNRKDLFTQHIRRMHFSSASRKPAIAKGSHPIDMVTEQTLKDCQDRCYRSLRSPPPQSACLFCNRVFQGPGSWDERMEHVGRHLEQNQKAGDGPIHISRWNEDMKFRQWLLEEGLIEEDAREGWKIGDGIPTQRSNAPNEDNDHDYDSVMDGEGDDCD